MYNCIFKSPVNFVIVYGIIDWKLFYTFIVASQIDFEKGKKDKRKTYKCIRKWFINCDDDR